MGQNTTTCPGCGAEMPVEVKEYKVGELVERYTPRYCSPCQVGFLASLDNDRAQHHQQKAA